MKNIILNDFLLGLYLTAEHAECTKSALFQTNILKIFTRLQIKTVLKPYPSGHYARGELRHYHNRPYAR